MVSARPGGGVCLRQAGEDVRPAAHHRAGGVQLACKASVWAESFFQLLIMGASRKLTAANNPPAASTWHPGSTSAFVLFFVRAHAAAAQPTPASIVIALILLSCA